MRTALIVVLAAMMIEGCSGMRPTPPADPNQALLMIFQQRSLEKMVGRMSGEALEEEKKKYKAEIKELKKLLREAISKPCSCPETGIDSFRG